MGLFGMQWLIDLVYERVMQNFAGVIVAWSGSIDSIPVGWALCDGTQGTPDLTDRFIMGAGDTYDPNDTGGHTSHDHTFTADSHYHINYLDKKGKYAEGEWKSWTDARVVTGSTHETSNMSPYYALAFIMRL